MSLSLLLAVSGAAFAADSAAPLPAGQPAGVKKAQEQSNMLVLGIGVAAVAAGIALVASDDDGTAPIPNTTPVTTAP